MVELAKIHRGFGIILFIPFLAWAVTGFIFFIKPGYNAAYETLAIKSYPLESQQPVNSHPDWLEYRVQRTILGTHLIAKTADGWVHLDPATMQPRSQPSNDDMRLLLNDAFTSNPERYGRVAAVSGDSAVTSTGINVIVDWTRMSLQQRGRDTDRIDLLYRIHYLQWTGNRKIDRILGLAGLAGVIILAVLGARLAFRASRVGGRPDRDKSV
jgi:hypothetical protein